MHAILAALALSAGPPGLTAPAAGVDRGSVRTGPPLVHAFAVTNPGPGPVVLLGVTTPCGCIAGTVGRDRLAPGESATVTLTVNTLTQPAGPQTWRGMVRYAPAPSTGETAPGRDGSRRVGSDSESVRESKELPWSVAATLVAEVTVNPPMLALSTDSDAPVTVTVTVSDARTKRLTLLGASLTSKHLGATVGPAVDASAGRAVPVAVTLLPGHPAGVADETLVLRTDDPACPELRVPVKVHKRDRQAVVATPAAARVPLAPGQAAGSALVQLRSPTGAALKVQGATADHPAVSATWATAGRLATVRVTVTPRPGDPPRGSATVTVTLADPAGARVTLPVTWEP